MATVATNFPWLVPQETPGQALSRGVAVGSRVGETMMRGRIASDEMRYRSDQMRLAQQQQELNNIVIRQQMQGRALEISEGLRKRDDELANRHTIAKIEQYWAQGTRNNQLNDPKWRAGIYDIASQYPAVRESPFFGEMEKRLHNHDALQVDKLRILGMNPANYENVMLQVEAEIRAGTLKPEGKDARIAELMAQKNFPKGSSRTITGYDAQGNPIFSITEGGAAPTPATMNRVQANLNAAQKNYDILSDLESTLRPEDLGFRGVVGEFKDRYAGQIGEGQAVDLTRADNRTKLRVAVQSMVRQISSDTGRFSEGDRNRAEAAQVSLGVDESYPRAMEVLQTLKQIISDRARIDAQTGAIEAPAWALSPDDIKARVKANQMTPDQAQALIQKYHPLEYRRIISQPQTP